MAASFLAPLVRDTAATPALIRPRDGAVVARRLEAAFDSATRRRGLLGRDTLAADAALVIAPCNAVHTFFMRFAIDVVFVAGDGTVVKIARGVAPFRMTASPSAFATIEFAAGAPGVGDLMPGDVLAVAAAD